MSQHLSMSHIIGTGAKWAGTITILGLAGLLSFLFFQRIAPKDQQWFPYAGLALTEGGMVLWLAVFRLTNYHPLEKSIALLMVGACMLASFSAAGYEFYSWMSAQLQLSQPAWVQQMIATLLEVMFFLHMIAFAIELLSAGFEGIKKQGYSFRGPLHVMQDVRTSEPAVLARTVDSHLLPSPVEDEQQDVRTTHDAQPARKKRTLIPAGVKRYMSGQPLTAAHGRDCICSSCRPDMHTKEE